MGQRQRWTPLQDQEHGDNSPIGARMGDTRAGDVDKRCVVGEIGAGFAGSSQCNVGAPIDAHAATAVHFE